MFVLIRESESSKEAGGAEGRKVKWLRLLFD